MLVKSLQRRGTLRNYGGVSMAILGLIIILGVNIAYLTMLFVLHRFTYKTWIFDVAVGAGMVLGFSSWF